MFENLTDRLSRTLRNISGRGRLTEENIKETLREVRMALLEADVALPVVRDFINRVKESAVGHEVNKSLTPGQEFVKIVKSELIAAMGEVNTELNLAAQPPAVVLMAGLQGAGKTTSVGKLGKFLKEKQKKKCWWFPPTFIVLRRLNSWKRWLKASASTFSRRMPKTSRSTSLTARYNRRS
ncbi:SRP54-type protein, helical bundle domain protein [Serratia odorifera DSM 4582]|uniref:SRP54-type protein, helical bundle domain protein n=1 Tax=Serratia odorifera DSM 4582 TaxID=667129 RepID=D4DWW6_SEROD|nr:SRP54-type protein, helical bundle domain protein [Serratia odorifera DSM 4582]